MPGWSDIAEKMASATQDYWKERNERMLRVRKELELYFRIPQDTELARSIAWFLTSDQWR